MQYVLLESSGWLLLPTLGFSMKNYTIESVDVTVTSPLGLYSPTWWRGK